MAMYLMVFTIGAPLGSIIQGPLADQFGPRWVVAIMGSLFLTAAMLFAVSGRAATFNFDETDN